MTAVFCRYELRSVDPIAARTFYAEVLGASVETLGFVVLPERARALGAPSHWLGHLGVDDVEATARKLVELGAERLGPMQRAADGAEVSVLRDPAGAAMAVRARVDRRASVAWHHLHTRDLDRAWAAYSASFGWTHIQAFDVPNLEVEVKAFAWDDTGQSVGSMANTARLPGVHAHWMFHFPVGDLEGAMAKVRALGGTVMPNVTALPNGIRIAACEDMHGAAFGLAHQRF